MPNSSLNQPTVTDDSPAFVLRGNRFKPLAWENMSAEQQQMTTMSYYTLVCMSLNVDDYPLPDGVEPELAAPWESHP